MCNKYLVFCKHLTITISISTATTVTISDVSITTTDVMITIPRSPLISTCLMLSLHNNELNFFFLTQLSHSKYYFQRYIIGSTIFNHFLNEFIYLFYLYNLIQKKKQ
ncbi:hypothetical protein POPTR_002G234850v4 [Populus trichocarpa]|uniref:Uncharacterized protein n=1 Tax=Populus trichocarpa TaxID=3694 RepID=A0ACC0TG27_POPTR|nr:hypothetical protein BDE02_02G210600 [Populus trichocarpa]KAI9400368.1 hypothetical protein POPTR_002G234850v4 [Populus trichocarpa]